MPATASRIAFIVQPYRTAVRQDAEIKRLYGNLARDTAKEPIVTFFESVDDAEAAASERLSLLGQSRRRFEQEIADDPYRQLQQALALRPVQLVDSSGAQIVDEGGRIVVATPPLSEAVSVRLIDDAQQADFVGLIAEMIVDLDAGTTTIGVWG